jgi:hypothetical protein
MTETDSAYGDARREGDDPGTASDVDTSAEAPNLIPDVVPTVGNLLPNGLPLLPGVGPDLAGPGDPKED